MEHISIYNTQVIEGLEELIATIDCDLEEDERFLIVVNNDEIANDENLKAAMIEAVRNGVKIIVVWPHGGSALPLPEILRQVRSAVIQFDAEALHDVICTKSNRDEGPDGGLQPAPETKRHCC